MRWHGILEEAVDLVLFAFEKGENGDLLIMKAPACTIGTQAEAVCELFGGKKEDIKVIGIRHFTEYQQIIVD